MSVRIYEITIAFLSVVSMSELDRREMRKKNRRTICSGMVYQLMGSSVHPFSLSLSLIYISPYHRSSEHL